MRRNLRCLSFLLLAVLLCVSTASACDHHWKDTPETTERWEIQEHSHQKLNMQGMTCSLCGETGYRRIGIVSGSQSHRWQVTAAWHEPEKAEHVYQQTCLDCGVTSLLTLPCPGQPCMVALAAPAHAEITLCAHAEEHCWYDMSESRTRMLDDQTPCVERKMVCTLCHATAYRGQESRAAQR